MRLPARLGRLWPGGYPGGLYPFRRVLGILWGASLAGMRELRAAM